MSRDTYPDRIAVLPRVLAAADATGEEVESWPDPTPAQEHWARIDSFTGTADGELPRGADERLRLLFRHLVTLAAEDRVRLKDTGDVYSVVGVWRERHPSGRGWQTVCSLVNPTY